MSSTDFTLDAIELLLRAAPVPMALSRIADGRLVAANESFARLCGYGPEESVGRSVAELSAWAETDERRVVIEALRQHGEVRAVPHLVRHRSGRLLRTLLSARAVALDGEPHFLAVIGDVSESTRLQWELASAEDALRLVEDNAHLGIWDWDLALGRLRWSPGMAAVFGIRLEDFGGRVEDFAALLHPDDRAQLAGAIASALEASGPIHHEARLLRPDGSVRWLASRGAIVRDAAGKPARIVGVCLDITAEKSLALGWRDAQEKLRVILSATDVLVFQHDLELRYEWIANPVLGLEERDVLGRTDAQLLGDAVAAPLTEIKRRVLETGRGERREVRVSRDGQQGCFELVAEPRRDERGQVVGLLCAAQDISERKRLEAEREAYRARLQGLAAHLQDTIEAERTAVAREVHDALGATLTGIQLSLASLMNGSAEPGARRRSRLQSIQRAVEAAIQATRALSSRLRPPALEGMPLAATVRWYARDWSGTTGIKVRCRITRRRLELARDTSVELFRVLQELLTNVARHSGARAVRVGLDANAGVLELCVADDGHGFEPDGAHQGFGLVGINERAQRLGGRVAIRSGPRGSVVTVSIPQGRAA
ncbi:MAG: PAS domain S-box protein [Proteobacteria bacterium]|nr:PAS domain S-box protein [Pseudomonadota bacterium]